MRKPQRTAKVILSRSNSAGYRVAVQVNVGKAVESVHVFDVTGPPVYHSDRQWLAESIAKDLALYPTLKPEAQGAEITVRVAANL